MSKAYVNHILMDEKCQLFVFVNIKDESDVEIFQYSKLENSLPELKKFLDQCKKNETVLIGYNMLSVITQLYRSPLDGATYIRYKDIIKRFDNHELPLYSNDAGSKNLWNIYDLSIINGYGNLDMKVLQCSLNWNNVSSTMLGIDKKKDITEFEEMKFKIDAVKETLFIKDLFLQSKPEILFRNQASKEFNIQFKNDSKPSIAKRIFLYKIAEKMNIAPYELLQLQSNFNTMQVKNILHPKISFRTREFQLLYQQYANLTINNQYLDKINFKVKYRGMEISLGLGGIHGSKPGIYRSNKYFVVKSLDAKNFYANLAINNRYAPSHIPVNVFTDVLKSFKDKRDEHDPGTQLNEIYKSLMTNAYGLSNAKGSFMKDCTYMLKCTINGQLILLMLLEILAEKIPGTRPIMLNTDGLEVIIPREHEELYNKLCEKWTEVFNLELKHDHYSMMVVANSSNYLAVSNPVSITEEEFKIKDSESIKELIRQKDDKYYYCPVKLKGVFNYKRKASQDPSFRIVSIALYNYFIHKIQVEDTIMQHKNIFDFLAIAIHNKHSALRVNTKIFWQRILRYYKSKEGHKIEKRQGTTWVNNEKGGKETLATLINPQTPITEYDLDYELYIAKTKRELTKVLKVLEV